LFNKASLLSEITDEYLRADLMPPDLDASIRERFSRMCVFEAFVEELPSPDNRLTIDWSDRDTAGQPRICLNFARSDYAKRGTRSAITLLNKFAAQLGARRSALSEPHSRDHIIGTLRMGLDARTSVVDRECRAHDHPNLFVAGIVLDS
jgi:choline dehydrogenase-like flavoprotein